MSIQSPAIDVVFEAILSLKTREECYQFFEDVCTIGELQAMSQRFSVAVMLNDGKSYQEVEAATGASSATISRVNRCLRYGSGGYKRAIERIQSDDIG